MFYDENGKHVRTKKEILGEDGEIREGCSIVKKGEVYEKKLFTAKDERFKCNSFLDEVKHSYTDLINIYVQDEKQKLQVFERGSVYLATKKIGKIDCVIPVTLESNVVTHHQFLYGEDAMYSPSSTE